MPCKLEPIAVTKTPIDRELNRAAVVIFSPHS